MKREDIAIAALQNVINQQSIANYAFIINGFVEKGIPEGEIFPRQNVFTFHAWRALGRTVRKGEHGVQVITWIPCSKTDKETGEVSSYKTPKTTTVFHISQTEEFTK